MWNWKCIDLGSVIAGRGPGVGHHPWVKGSSVSWFGLFWDLPLGTDLKRKALGQGGCVSFPLDYRCHTHCETRLWTSFPEGLMAGVLHSFLSLWPVTEVHMVCVCVCVKPCEFCFPLECSGSIWGLKGTDFQAENK